MFFQELGSAPIERLYMGNCSQPVLDRLPQGPVRSLQITNCSIKEVKSEVSSANWWKIDTLTRCVGARFPSQKFGCIISLVAITIKIVVQADWNTFTPRMGRIFVVKNVPTSDSKFLTNQENRSRAIGR